MKKETKFDKFLTSSYGFPIILQKKLLKAKRELADLKVQEKALVSARNKIRRDNHNHYEPQLTAIRDQIQGLVDFLTKI